MLPQVKKKDRLIQLCLLLSSFSIYAFQFRSIFFRLNQVLSSITLDSIKNYYTFAYHVKHDTSLLRFDGMNYPFSEHVIYSDCQPLIGAILKALPFLHSHLIGCMHLLMFFSFIISPLIIYKILRRAELQQFSSFGISLAIGLLAPQFLKINAGHFALAYGCIIPYSILLLQKQLGAEGGKKSTWLLFCYHLAIFLLHPYMGICLSLFTALSLGLSLLVNKQLRSITKYLEIGISSLLPIVLFMLFMKLTDTHQNRTHEPFGAEVMVENVSSILAPDFGPFQQLLENLLPAKPSHFEGHTYLGLITILASLLLLVLLPFHYKQLRFTDAISLLFFASLVILGISFGLHQKLLKALHINSSAVNQFRAVCRFAWVFYYTLPLFVFLKLQQVFSGISVSHAGFRYALPLIASVFLVVNVVESSAMFHLNENAYWKFRNFFNAELLTKKENAVLESFLKENYQAILPLPYFEGGSEMYDRNGASASMAPGMMYSFHTGLPLYSVMMSRSSITETEQQIDLFNMNHKQRPLLSALATNTFLVIKTNDPLLPDELRLQKNIRYFSALDSLNFGTLALSTLHSVSKRTSAINLDQQQDSLLQKAHVVYVKSSPQSPYAMGSTNTLSKAYALDSLVLPTGKYIISLQYYYAQKEYQNVSCNLIVTEKCKGNYRWRDIYPIRKLSGFYKDYAVFEDYISLDSTCSYEFLLQGIGDRNYHISDFLLRPENEDVYYVRTRRDTCYNNFPAY